MEVKQLFAKGQATLFRQLHPFVMLVKVWLALSIL